MSASRRTLTYLSYSLLGILIMIAGCTGNTVSLKYNPSQNLTTPPCEDSIKLSTFRDNREKSWIGTKAEGDKFYAENDVSQWVTFALFEELQNADCNVYLESRSENVETDYTVKGVIEDINLKQLSTLKFSNTIKLKIKLLKNNKVVYHESFIGYIKKNSLVPANMPEKIMAAGLQDLMQEITFKVIGAMK